MVLRFTLIVIIVYPLKTKNLCFRQSILQQLKGANVLGELNTESQNSVLLYYGDHLTQSNLSCWDEPHQFAKSMRTICKNQDSNFVAERLQREH